MLALLAKRLWFPDPRFAKADGLMAVSGDLSVPRLPRAIFELDKFHVPRSQARLLRKEVFRINGIVLCFGLCR